MDLRPLVYLFCPREVNYLGGHLCGNKYSKTKKIWGVSDKSGQKGGRVVQGQFYQVKEPGDIAGVIEKELGGRTVAFNSVGDSFYLLVREKWGCLDPTCP